MPRATTARNCTTCKHFRSSGVNGTTWHCALLTRAELVADGYQLPDAHPNGLADFVCEDWEPP